MGMATQGLTATLEAPAGLDTTPQNFLGGFYLGDEPATQGMAPANELKTIQQQIGQMGPMNTWQQPQWDQFNTTMGHTGPEWEQSLTPNQEMPMATMASMDYEMPMATMASMDYDMLFNANPAPMEDAPAINQQLGEANLDGGTMYSMQLGSPVTTSVLPTGLSGLQQQISPVTQPTNNTPVGFSGRSGYGAGNQRMQTTRQQPAADLDGNGVGTKTA